MAAGRPAKYPILVLQADDIHIADIQEVSRAHIREQILLFDFEANDIGVCIALFDVVHGHRKALARAVLGSHREQEIGRKCRDAALTGRIIAEKRDLSNLGALNHRAFLAFCERSLIVHAFRTMPV